MHCLWLRLAPEQQTKNPAVAESVLASVGYLPTTIPTSQMYSWAEGRSADFSYRRCFNISTSTCLTWGLGCSFGLLSLFFCSYGWFFGFLSLFFIILILGPRLYEHPVHYFHYCHYSKKEQERHNKGFISFWINLT